MIEYDIDGCDSCPCNDGLSCQAADRLLTVEDKEADYPDWCPIAGDGEVLVKLRLTR